ncbi:MAG: NAD(P)H-dependent oxidoreductase subunit E [Anaerolineae bacterium]|nr:NAD(P)H-dependent oxidoreductase subunit E [Anaerolineae bacterium]MBN8621267.1 NAD(P)H-dependent oxidoreductase subunit E [Anaerolineae bacterium]
MRAYAQHLIACEGKDCSKHGGGKKIIKQARKLMGAAGREVKCSTVSCLGYCKQAPVVMVYPDGVWYQCPDKRSVKRVVKRHVMGGKLVKEHILLNMAQYGKAKHK